MKYIESKYFRNQIGHAISFLILVVFFIQHHDILSLQGKDHYWGAVFFIFLSLVYVATAKGLYDRYRRKKKKTIETKTELLRQISKPGVIVKLTDRLETMW